MKKYVLIFISIVLVFFTTYGNEKTPLSASIEKMTMYWDASYSMQERDLAREFQFLEEYFTEHSTVAVHLVVFSTTINVEKKFVIQNSNWQSLKKTLQNTVYDGLALFTVLQRKTTADKVFVFTDGITTLDRFILNKNTPAYILSSTKNANQTVLVSESSATGGDYMNLLQTTTTQVLHTIEKVRPKKNRRETKFLRKGVFKSGKIQGTVFDIDGVLAGATIKIKGKKRFVLTNKNGDFSIKAALSDILLVSYVGKQQQEVTIEDNEFLNLFLSNDKNTLLDEVVVKRNLKKEEDLIDVGFGMKKDFNSIGYAVQVIKSEDFSAGAYTLKQVLSSNINSGRISVNSIGVIGGALLVIDGSPLAKDRPEQMTSTVDMLDPGNIASITVLSSFAATNKYGSEGAGGVILITSKAMALHTTIKKKPKNTALVQNNTYTEKAVPINSATLYNIDYIQELEKLKTFQAVYEAYLLQRKNYKNSLLYFIHLADYIFLWGNKKAATKILTNVIENDPKNVSLLRLAAYKLEEEGQYFLARDLYKRVQELKPKEAQSYRDLALIYVQTKEYKKALTIYRNIYNKKYKGVDFTGLKRIITKELQHLITVKGKEINTLGLSKKYTLPKKSTTRIVIEWSNTAASFELQFVNPQQKFFTWAHTKDTNGLRLYNEKQQGLYTEEFILDTTNKGEWILNIESKQQKMTQPIAVKYTVYKNYGLRTEVKETKVIILNNLTTKQMLGKIVI